MNEKMDYYLLENKLLTHGIGDINDKETYFKFESIIKNGGLMSLQKLKELGINVSGKVSRLRGTPESKIFFLIHQPQKLKQDYYQITIIIFYHLILV